MLNSAPSTSGLRAWWRAEQHQERKAVEWAESITGPVAVSWADTLLKRWREARKVDETEANRAHLRACKRIAGAARAGLKPDANDWEICRAAELTARDMGRRLDMVTRMAAQELADREPAQRDRLLMLARCLDAMHWMDGRGLLHRFTAACAVGIPGALRRVVCDRWWRRILRRVHARGVESTARAIGMVHKRAGCYASDDAVRKRKGQNARNAKALESVVAVNERGQEYTLAELAAKGTANKEIRRCELMTRIAGFELVAKECGHIAYMVTVTTPSRMHAYRSKPGTRSGVEQNPKHDGTTPDDAQRYLTKQWAKCRAAAARAGLGLYGFRIAEPNHDATPHWHMLVFMPERTERERLSYRVLVRLLRRYFLWNSDGRERGARKHRVGFERIDWRKGSAVGYVAKYVSKNIDGHAVEKDLYGNDAMTSSQRVEAWAATWGIRQFQQIGGAPVGVWRELRRVHEEQAQVSELLACGLDAVNITADRDPLATDIDREQTAAHGWHSYTALQGGPNVKRAALRMRLQRDDHGEVGRYGERMAPRVVGVVLDSFETVTTPAFGIVPETRQRRRIRREVESERCTWLVVPKGGKDAAAARLLALPDGEAVRPWSPVNNCTRHPAPLFAPAVQRVPKVGRFTNWSRGRRTKETKNAPDSREQHEIADPADRFGGSVRPAEPAHGSRTAGSACR